MIALVAILHAWEWLTAVLNGNSSTIPGNAALYALGIVWLDLRAIDRDHKRHATLRTEIHDAVHVALRPDVAAAQSVATDINRAEES